MENFDYLIVGGGMVADAAARGIREIDADGTIGILSADVDEPYTRPALTKKLWTDPEFTWEKVPLGTADATGATILLETLVTEIDRTNRVVGLADGAPIGYGKLLLATGSKPKQIVPENDERIIHFRSAADYRRLRALATPGARAVVVGGGYIGSELAAALAQNEVAVDLVFPDDVLGASTFPAALADHFQALFTTGGVNLVPGRRVEDVRTAPETIAALLDDGSELEADFVVFGLGVEPVTGLAEEAGLPVENGVIVDASLRTADPAIWAAGDIASYPDAIMGRTRVEHVDNANEMGRAAGRSLAGADEPYDHTPYFYSQVFGVRWEAVGTLDPSLNTLQVDLDSDRSVVYYRDESGAPVGVLLWNVADARDAARAVLIDAPTDDDALREAIR